MRIWESLGLDRANVINIAESDTNIIRNSTFDLFIQVIQNVYAYYALFLLAPNPRNYA